MQSCASRLQPLTACCEAERLHVTLHSTPRHAIRNEEAHAPCQGRAGQAPPRACW